MFIVNDDGNDGSGRRWRDGEDGYMPWWRLDSRPWLGMLDDSITMVRWMLKTCKVEVMSLRADALPIHPSIPTPVTSNLPSSLDNCSPLRHKNIVWLVPIQRGWKSGLRFNVTACEVSSNVSMNSSIHYEQQLHRPQGRSNHLLPGNSSRA